MFVHKTFLRTTWDRGAISSLEREKGTLCYIQKDLATTRKHSPKNDEAEETLTKEYQYKSSYQGKY